MNIWTCITDVVARLDSLKGTVIPHVVTVKARHSMPLRVAEFPALTVYWANELPASRLRNLDAIELSVRALVLTPERDAMPDATLHEVYAGIDGDPIMVGLKGVLQNWPPVGYCLDLAEARPIEPEETTQGRFTAGIECRLVLQSQRFTATS